jgi:1-acyl-sn-glycerol-3-phosphate acyltransferase
MTEPDGIDGEAGRTVELALSEVHSRLPATTNALRDELPGIEPDRRVTDWGRSERVQALADRTYYEFLYRYWFRVEVQGIENVPDAGGAMLAANRAGAVASDGAMIAKAVGDEHQHPRSVHVCAERQFAGLPGVGMLVTKLGGVAAHPANLHRLLFDERELVLVFPEGRRGRAKTLKDRYRLRRFDGGDFVRSAMRAAVPIVPLAVVGAEEARPVFARVGLPRRLTRLPALPVAPALPFPAKFKLRFLEPVATDGLGEEPWREDALVRGLEDNIRALIQENLLEMVGERRSVWLG